MSRKTIKKIIISRTDNIGDVVLTLPIAGAIKRYLPDSDVLFLGKEYVRPLVTTSQYIDEFISLDELQNNRFADRISIIKNYRADAIIHVFPNKQIARIASKAKIMYRVGTSHRSYHWYTCNRLINLGRKNSNLHESQLNLHLLSKIDIPYHFELKEIPDLFGLTKYPKLDKRFWSLIDKNRFNLILHPKSKGSAREWGENNFGRLIEILPEEKYNIFISGTAKEGNLLKSFIKKYKKRVVDITGKMNLDEFISFIKNSDGLVAASTGPLHIAAALGIYTIGLFAPMRPIHPSRWAPIGTNADYLVLDKECNDCKNQSICNCILSIHPESVKNLLDKI